MAKPCLEAAAVAGYRPAAPAHLAIRAHKRSRFTSAQATAIFIRVLRPAAIGLNGRLLVPPVLKVRSAHFRLLRLLELSAGPPTFPIPTPLSVPMHRVSLICI